MGTVMIRSLAVLERCHNQYGSPAPASAHVNMLQQAGCVRRCQVLAYLAGHAEAGSLHRLEAAAHMRYISVKFFKLIPV